MNNEESLALYEKGVEAWNIWANDMLTKKAKLEEDGKWQAEEYGRRVANQATKDWMDDSSVDFSKHTFAERMNFSHFIFPYLGNFHEVTFIGGVKFNNATFSDHAWFDNATFNGDTQFNSATFNSGAWFDYATFSDSAAFDSAIFSAHTGFDNATFNGFARFDSTTFGDHAVFDSAIFNDNTNFYYATFSDEALFNDATFNGNAGFYYATFNGFAGFDSVTFSDHSGFPCTTFRGEARFHNAKFCGNTGFPAATFCGEAQFDNAKFCGDTGFTGATFCGDAIFNRTLFEGFTSFTETSFEKNSSFIAIKGQSFFSFMDAQFHLVPDFTQAHFIEAPQFDNPDFSKALTHHQSKREDNLSSKWRSLKRLAIQGHDHERELIFFAEEIKSQRYIQDKAFPNPLNYLNNKPVWPGGTRYWFGYFYQYLSDFGRSVMWPLIWLLILGVLFYIFYLKYPIEDKPTLTQDECLASTILSGLATIKLSG